MSNVHVITGGGGGIGFGVAERIKEGIVVLVEISEDRLVEPKKQLEAQGLKVETFVSDISNEESVIELIEFANSLGKIKTFVNSAGVSGDIAPARANFNINLLGSYYICKNLLPYVEEGTVLLLVASMVGHLVDDRNEDYMNALINPELDGSIDLLVDYVKDNSTQAYNYSKQGVLQLVKRFAMDYGLKGGRILSFSPGIIMTPMAEKSAQDHPEQMNYMKKMTPAQRNGLPEDMANLAAFLISDQASFITGTDILSDGGLLINLPEIVGQK